MAFGSISFSENHRNLVIPYIGTANPALTADLTTYEYSLDGSIWETMTPTLGTVTTGLAFISGGGSFTFTWTIKDDIGTNIYNKEILIRLQATSSGMTTTMINRSLYFSKEVSSSDARKNKPKLPDDYSGISGSDLLVRAPKAKT
jgi:hypothetical protein